MTSSTAALMYGSIVKAPAGAAARLISDAVMGHRGSARVLCSELEHLARCDAGGELFLARLPEIRRQLGL